MVSRKARAHLNRALVIGVLFLAVCAALIGCGTLAVTEEPSPKLPEKPIPARLGVHVIDVQELYEYRKPQVQRVARRTYNTEQVPQLIIPPALVTQAPPRLVER